jgi:hypothetical protein
MPYPYAPGYGYFSNPWGNRWGSGGGYFGSSPSRDIYWNSMQNYYSQPGYGEGGGGYYAQPGQSGGLWSQAAANQARDSALTRMRNGDVLRPGDEQYLNPMGMGGGYGGYGGGYDGSMNRNRMNAYQGQAPQGQQGGSGGWMTNFQNMMDQYMQKFFAQNQTSQNPWGKYGGGW